MGRLIFVLCVLVLTACASAERDTRYLHSEQRPALKIPVGLMTPKYNEQMRVPDVAGQASQAADGQPSDPRFDLERPPSLADTE